MGSRKIVTKIKDALSRGSRSPSPEAGPSTRGNTTIDNPFTRFVLSNLDEQDHKMVAMAFAPQIQTDCDGRSLDFDDFFHLLGTEKRNALRILKRTLGSQIVSLNNEQKSTGRPRDVYMISVNHFEEVLLAANTEAGKKWRKLVLKIKNLVVQYMKIELEVTQEKMSQFAVKDEERAARLAIAEQEKAALATQLKNLREAKTYLYAFHLFDDRYKCGVTDNPEKREKQHQTSCPSGRMVHTVVIACKQSEKLMDSIMKRHGNHVRQEEYQIEGGEERVRLVLNTIARIEETLHSVPLDKYAELLSFADGILDTPNVITSQDALISNVRDLDSEILSSREDGNERARNSQTRSPATRDVQRPALSRIDQWLVHQLETQTLPAIMMAQQLEDAMKVKHLPKLSTVVIKRELAAYEGKGVHHPESTIRHNKMRGIPYYFDARRLTDTLVSLGKMEPPVVESLSSATDEQQ